MFDRSQWSSRRSAFTLTRRDLTLICSVSAAFLLITRLDTIGNSLLPAGSSTSVPSNEGQHGSVQSVLEKESELHGLGFDQDVGAPDSPVAGQRRPHHEISPHVNQHGGASQEISDNTKLWWTNGEVPETKIVVHSPGWTIFDQLYMLNGTIYVVSTDPSSIPERWEMTSSGYPVLNPPEEFPKREPTDQHMRIVSPKEASELFGYGAMAPGTGTATRFAGVTFLANDPPQFIPHYYHFVAELLYGLWRTYSSLDTLIPISGETKLPLPQRMIFTHTPSSRWRDPPKLNQFVMHAAFPTCSMAFEEEWIDRSETGRVHVFERVVFGDRAASMRGKDFVGRPASEAIILPGSAYWWNPVRRNVLNFIGVPEEEVLGTAQVKPVITYVSRQGWGRRILKEEDHLGLVAALRDLEAKYGYEVNIVEMQKMSKDEQIRLAGRTTILMGVHGNGLTALLWMLPTARSTVIEFLYPGGFALDYESSTRGLGMRHYGFWGSESFTAPNTPPVNYPEGFQGSNIPIDGVAVAKLVHERLSMNEGLDD